MISAVLIYGSSSVKISMSLKVNVRFYLIIFEKYKLTKVKIDCRVTERKVYEVQTEGLKRIEMRMKSVNKRCILFRALSCLCHVWDMKRRTFRII